jgi:nucleoid DNA-binding protein
MNEKITLQNIINLLCEKQGISPKDSETFVRTMFDVIEEALTNEKYVKIKGLGTFKLTEVNSRESVHVNTGERIEIQGHSKVSFTPDTSMKELINKPFSHFETVVLNEGVELEDTAVEEVEILETTDVSETTIVIEETTPPAPSEEVIPTEETPVEEPIIEVPATEETIVEEIVEEEETIIEQPIVEEPIAQEPIAEGPIVEESEPEVPVKETIEETKKEEEKTVSIEEKEETHIPVVPQDKEKNEKSINRILWGVIVVLVLIILFGVYWMFLRSEETPEVKPVVPVQEEQMAEPAPVAEEKPQEETLKIVQFIELSEEELRKERVPSFADTLDYQIVGTQEEYTLQKGETIIRASVRFFGTKKFWPYIVKHNMDVLPDPDNIPAGIRIKIPKLVEKNK